MLWYKSWLETRWRFLIGLAVLIVSACSVVFIYPRVAQMLDLVPTLDLKGEIGRRVRATADLQRDYRGYIWSQWFRQNLTNQWTFFAVLLGSGGLLAQGSGDAALFTLSLPVSRKRLVVTRAATGLVELLILAVIPSLLVLSFSPAVGESYGLANTVVYSLCLFIAGATFFSFAMLLSTVFTDIWRPLLIVLAIAAAIGLYDPVLPGFARYSVYRVMAAESYFLTGQLPWIGLVASLGVSAAMLYAAAVNVARRDF